MNYSYLIIFFITLFSCTVKEQKEEKEEINKSGIFYPEVEQRSVIIGQIENFQKFSTVSRTIRLSVDDITIDEQVKYLQEIDDNGKFMFSIPLHYPTETYLGYADGRIIPYIFPDDTLVINCKLSKVGSLTDINASSYDAKHDTFQKEFTKQYYWIHKQITLFEKNLQKESSPHKLKNDFLEFEKLLHQRINSRIPNKQSNPMIYDYLKYTATYRCYKGIINAGKGIGNPQDKQVFFSFLNDSITFNKNALISSSYRNFLNHYSHHVEPRPLVRVLSSGKTEEQIKKDLVAKDIEYAMKLRTGIWRDFLIASKINSSVIQKEEEITASSIGFYMQLVQKNIQDKYLRELLMAKLNAEKLSILERDKVGRPVVAAVKEGALDASDQLFKEILEKNKGKVIYIDFWGTWCAACIEQFPYSRNLHSEFEDKDVAFVFLCCKSKKEAAENVIKKHRLKGQHYILTQKQYEYFEKQFQIVGLPRYVLIDKYGKIYSKDAPRPESKQTSIAFNKLLTE